MSEIKERTAADYAIEHAEYLAKAAEHYMEQRNLYDVAEQEGGLVDPDALSDAYMGLQSAVYEFRKRAAVAEYVPLSPTTKNDCLKSSGAK
jgi:hypothetical protein